MIENNQKPNSDSADKKSFLPPLKKLFPRAEAKKEISNDFTGEKRAAADWQLAKENESRTRQSNIATEITTDKKPDEKVKANFTIAKTVDVKPKTTEENKEQEKEETTPQKNNISLSNAKKAIIGTFKSSEDWKSARTMKTNLIQGEITTIIDWGEKKRFALYLLLVLVVIIGGFYFALLGWEYKIKHEAAELGDVIVELEKQIKTAEKTVKEVDNFQQKLKFVSSLLDKHIYWTNFFYFLEKNILTKAVILGGFAGGTEGEYVFNLRASEYIDIPDQVRVLRANDKVLDAWVLAGAQTTETTLNKYEEEINEKVINFSLNLTLKPTLFKND